MFQEIVGMDYFVDKSRILEDIVPLIGTANKYLCITRPRRFGKTIMANMIASYLSAGVQSDPVFSGLYVGKSEFYSRHLNRHHVIFIDFSDLPYQCKTYQEYIDFIASNLIKDLAEAYPGCVPAGNTSPWAALEMVFAKTGDKFVFIMDEWDSMFHNTAFRTKEQKEFLLFLKMLLKSRPYVELAYMTGVLPIAKYSSGSELNMFDEYNMAVSPKYSSYFGFTEKETEEIYERYRENERAPEVTLHELKEWYDGYETAGGEKIYNPRSVVRALQDNHIGSYWTNSGPYDEIFYYISRNIHDVREDIVRMVAGEEIPVKFSEYAALSLKPGTKDEIYSAMVVYGFLSYQNGRVSVPNKELMLKFQEVLSKKEMGYIARLTSASDQMLKATLDGDTETMEKILSFAHDTEVPILNYNQETDLAALVNLVYLSARDDYRIEREDRAGKGFADLLFYPNNPKDDCIIIELTVDASPEDAIGQIKEKRYDLRFKGYLGDVPPYEGRILAVGIAYDKKKKCHRCRVEVC